MRVALDTRTLSAKRWSDADEDLTFWCKRWVGGMMVSSTHGPGVSGGSSLAYGSHGNGLRGRLVRAMPFWARVMIRFRRKFGNVLPLRRPRTLNEKINWMKIFGEVELLTRCSDKVRVREYVEERLGADVCLPELYLVTENADDLTPSAIGRDRFVVKANHDSGSSILCKDSATFDYADARKKMSHYLKLSYSDFFMEPQYSGIVPKILVEEMIECSDGSPLGDYRMMCYGGRVEFFYVNVYEGGRKYRAYFDRDWRRFHVSQTSPDYPGIVEKPPFFDRLVSMSEQLAAPFDFVRVDWNIADDKLYFGELTFTPQAGFGRYDPPEMDLLLGEKLKLTRSRYRAVQWALARGLMG